MTILQELHEEPISQLDLSHYCTVSGQSSVKETVEKMQETKTHCAFVIEDDKLIGIFTDRDVLQKVVNKPEALEKSIQEVMTPNPRLAHSDYSIVTALKMMDEHHVRNLPVVSSSGEIIGNFTHHAFINFLADNFPADIYNRPPTSSPIARHRHGA